MMGLNDTIVACATPAGYSSVGVIRISGDQAIPIVRKIFTANENVQAFEAKHAYYGRINDPSSGDVIDRVIATFYLKPNSYTAEDVVEISCHGNPLIIDRIIKILVGLEARIAQRGEYTRRALLNGKIDLLQAEAVLDTVNAPCDEARKLAISQYEGKLSEKIYDLKSRIVDIVSLVEVNIDFPEEEDVQLVFPDTGRKTTHVITAIITEIEELLKGAEIGKKIKQGYKLLIMGRPNVGKSTLFNRLVGYDRAITHEKPGTTRDYIDDYIEISGLYVWLYDTAGVFDTAIGVDKIAAERTRALINEADLILLMFDGSEPMNEQDLALYDLTRSKNKMMIVNKIDLNLKLSRSEILSDSVKLSAKTGENIDLLTKGIRSKLAPTSGYKPTLMTRQRHINAIEKVREYLIRSQDAPSYDTIAFELYSALDVLSELTGKVMRKEILDQIFEEFCIGK